MANPACPLWQPSAVKWQAQWMKEEEWDFHLFFSEAFYTVSNNIFTDKLILYELDEWTVGWTENWLNCWAQRVLISDTESSWRPVTSGVPRGQYWDQYYLASSLMTEQIKVMEQSVPLASLQMTLNGQEQLTPKMTLLPLRPQQAGETGWQESH